MAEPLQLIAGTTIGWSVAAPVAAAGAGVYRASEGWALGYVLLGPAKVELTAEADGEGFRVAVAAADSAGWVPGWYQWSALVTRGAERYRVTTGQLEVLADPAGAPVGDARSHARRMLAAIEAVLEGRATADVEQYTTPHGVSLKKTPVPELLALRDRYLAEVAAEASAERRARGQPASRLVKMTGLGRRF